MRPRRFLTEDLRQVPERVDRHGRVLLAEALPGRIFLLTLLAQQAPVLVQGRVLLAQGPLLRYLALTDTIWRRELPGFGGKARRGGRDEGRHRLSIGYLRIRKHPAGIRALGVRAGQSFDL